MDYCEIQEEQVKNTEDVKGNLGVGKSTDKGLTKRLGLLNIGPKGGENENKITTATKINFIQKQLPPNKFNF